MTLPLFATRVVMVGLQMPVPEITGIATQNSTLVTATKAHNACMRLNERLPACSLTHVCEPSSSLMGAHWFWDAPLYCARYNMYTSPMGHAIPSCGHAINCTCNLQMHGPCTLTVTAIILRLMSGGTMSLKITTRTLWTCTAFRCCNLTLLPCSCHHPPECARTL
jgi:hypothetical protein